MSASSPALTSAAGKAGPEAAVPLQGRNASDRVYRGLLTALALILPATLVVIVFQLWYIRRVENR